MIPGRARLGAAMALAILVVDQASKWWILEVFDLPAKLSVPLLPVLNLTMVWNRGITFGMKGGIGHLWNSLS